MKKVLFIADGSLSNPILQSQGLPQLVINSDFGCIPFMMSFENPLVLSQNSNDYNRYLETKALFGEKITLVEVIVPFANANFILQNQILRALRFLLMILKGIYAVVQLTNREKIDVIHCRSSYPTIIGVLSKFFTGARVIYDNRGIWSEESKGGHFNILPMLYHIIESVLLRFVDKVVVVSKPFREHLLSNYAINNLDKKITVIKNGFSPERITFTEDSRITRRKEENLHDRLVMVYSGTLSKWQMFDQICEAFLCLKSMEPKALFLVLSPDSAQVSEILGEKGIADSDYKIFNITNNQLGKYLILGDFGTLFREKLILNKVSAPIKFAEYLGAGLPVLLTKGIGDTEEICHNGEFGVVIEDLQRDVESSLVRMIQLLNQEGIHQKCSDMAIKEISVNSAAEKYRAIYFARD